MRAWLNGPIIPRRWQVLALSALVGVGVAVGIIAVVGLADERTKRSVEGRASIRREIARERAARRRGDRLTRRVARLERPTTADLERAIHRALRVLREHPQLAGQIARQLAAIAAPPSTAATRPLERGSTGLGDRGDTSRPSTPATRRPSRRPDRSPGPNPDTSSPTSPTTHPPPPARPPVTVTVPPALPLPCVGVTTPAVGVDCPR